MTILGGDPFAVRVPGNPPLRHDGTRTIVPIYGSEETISKVYAIGQNHGCHIKVTSQGETPEARAERQAFLDAQSPDAVFPSIKCPGCYWFDLMLESNCGLDVDDGWPEETVAAGRESEVGAECEAECPVERAPF